MSFLIYFFVLLICATSMVFGLDLLNSALHPPPNVPIGRSVHHIAADVATHGAKTKSEIQPDAGKRTVAEGARKSATGQSQADSRELRPVYTDSSKPPAELTTIGNATADQTAATKSHDVAAAIRPDAEEPAPQNFSAIIATPAGSTARPQQPIGAKQV
jgi:hypothetical protein